MSICSLQVSIAASPDNIARFQIKNDFAICIRRNVEVQVKCESGKIYFLVDGLSYRFCKSGISKVDKVYESFRSMDESPLMGYINACILFRSWQLDVILKI